MKNVVYLSLTLFLASLLITCKDRTANFSPGEADSRIAGTWQLVERRFQKDSVQIIDKDTIITRRDTSTVLVGGVPVKRDTLISTRQVTRTTRNLTIDTVQRYPSTPLQTLTFDTDGKLTARGNQMTYYNPIRYFRVDKTYPDSLFVDFFISTNGATVPFRQGLDVQPDVLMLKPNCERPCYSKFVRVK